MDNQIMSEGDSISQIASHPIYYNYPEYFLKGHEFLNDESMTRKTSIKDNHIVHASSQIDMHPIDQTDHISPHHQLVINKKIDHKINVLPENDLQPIYDHYP